MEWLESNRIQIIPPKKPKKLTGTRFATILGLNPWSTPFEVWCEVTRTYQKPFEETKYTAAGKAIEPKQAEYMRKSYFMPNMTTPADLWGEDYFKKTWGDFFPETPILGGMWDYILCDEEGHPTAVLEMKTTKRAEDWASDVPEYYALQAALYAYLLGVDDVIMVASFLEDGDYQTPEEFRCDLTNTITRPFKVSERYPDFEKRYVKPALQWWHDHVETGISPSFNEKKDAEILKVLRTNNVNPETNLAELVREAEELKMQLDTAYATLAESEKRYKVLSDMIKKCAVAQFRPGDKKVSVPGTRWNWEVSRTSTLKVDKEAMKADGVLAKYTTTEESYRISPKEIKEE